MDQFVDRQRKDLAPILHSSAIASHRNPVATRIRDRRVPRTRSDAGDGGKETRRYWQGRLLSDLRSYDVIRIIQLQKVSMCIRRRCCIRIFSARLRRRYVWPLHHGSGAACPIVIGGY